MTVLIVLAVGVAVAAVLVAGALLKERTDRPADRAETRWFVTAAPSPVRRWLVVGDRRVIGGAAVAVGFAVVFVAALVVGSLFAGIQENDGLGGWDLAAAEYGARNATDTSTGILDMLTRLGGTLYLVVIMSAIGVYVGVRRADWGPGLYLAIVGVGISLLNNGLKVVVDRDRPDIARLAGYAGQSFPSGHSAAAAACWAGIALVVARRWNRRRRRLAAVVAIVIAVVVATTRVLLGVHWLSDVIAGVVVGWTWWFLTTIAFGGRLLRLGAVTETAAEPDDVDDAPLDDGRDDDTTRDERTRTDDVGPTIDRSDADAELAQRAGGTPR